jgi:predicted protein tyrosine phosphatase
MDVAPNLDIPDDYDFMDPDLVRILKAKVTPFLPAAVSPPHGGPGP